MALVQECSSLYQVFCSDVSVEGEARGGMGLGGSGLKGASPLSSRAPAQVSRRPCLLVAFFTSSVTVDSVVKMGEKNWENSSL